MSQILHRSNNLIVFQANGEGFTDGFDLYALEKLLPEYRRLLDASYFQITGQHAYRKQNRLVTYTSQFELGCLDVIVDITAKATPLALGVLAADGGGYQIAKMSFQLISKILELRKKVKELLESKKKLPEFHMDLKHVSLENTLLAPIQVNGNNNSITVAPQIYLGALASHSAVNRLAKAVDGVTVTDVNLQHAGLVGEKLTVFDRGLAEAPLGSSNQEIKIQGRLDGVTVSTRKGYLFVGDAKYPIDWDDSIKSKLLSAIDKEGMIFIARPIADFTRLSTEPVRFHIVDCEIGQLDLN